MLFHMPFPSIAGSELSRTLTDEAPMSMCAYDRWCSSILVVRKFVAGEVEESTATPRGALCTGTGTSVVKDCRVTARVG